MDLFFKIAGWVIFTFFTVGTLGIISSARQGGEPNTTAKVMRATVTNVLLLLWIYWAILRGS